MQQNQALTLPNAECLHHHFSRESVSLCLLRMRRLFVIICDPQGFPEFPNFYDVSDSIVLRTAPYVCIARMRNAKVGNPTKRRAEKTTELQDPRRRHVGSTNIIRRKTKNSLNKDSSVISYGRSSNSMSWLEKICTNVKVRAVPRPSRISGTKSPSLFRMAYYSSIKPFAQIRK